MDSAMFLITSGALGFDFAIAKTPAAVGVGVGLLGGFTVNTFASSVVFANPLRPKGLASGCGCGTALFLGKWLLLAYLLEAMMIHYLPADMIASVLGGDVICDCRRR